MIARNHRFHGLNSLRIVYKLGRTTRQQQLTLRHHLNERRQTYRCAVVVSKKVEKSAVRRNRIRRRIFEAVRQQQDLINKPYDLVIGVYSQTLTDMPSQELRLQVKDLLAAAGVIDAKPQR